MTPNWLINMASPQVGVPLKAFFVSVLLGLAPYNFLTCNAGKHFKHSFNKPNIKLM